MGKRFCSLLSGGKDSNYALYRTLKEGLEPSCILVVSPSRADSWMFHTPYTDLAALQVKSMGLEDFLVRESVSGVKEREVDELEHIIAREWERRGFDTLVVGALASRYQYERVKRIADRLGLEIFAPGWGVNPEEYLLNIIEEGIKFIIIKISVMGLPYELLGKPITIDEAKHIITLSRRYGFHPAFEGGEAETLVYDAPHYREKICLQARRTVEEPYVYSLIIEKALLKPKTTRECIIVDNERYP